MEDYLTRMHIGEGTRYNRDKNSDTIYVSSAAPTGQIAALREDLALLGRDVQVELGRE